MVLKDDWSWVTHTKIKTKTDEKLKREDQKKKVMKVKWGQEGRKKS